MRDGGYEKRGGVMDYSEAEVSQERWSTLRGRRGGGRQVSQQEAQAGLK